MEAARRERTGEVTGLLMSVAAEIAVNQRTLERLIEEPNRLVVPTARILETEFWDRNGLRTARALGDYGILSPIAQYYENAQRLKEGVEHGASTKEGVEELRAYAQACHFQGDFVTGQIFRYLSSMLSTEFAK